MDLPPVDVPLGRRIYLAYRAVSDELDRRLAAHGASLWMWLLLRSAIQNDAPSQRELAEHMRIEAPTVVRHLDKLEELGYVERRRDARDRRITRIYATAAGRKQFVRLDAVVAGADAELCGALGAPDVETLHRVLSEVQAHYEPALAREPLPTRGGAT